MRSAATAAAKAELDGEEEGAEGEEGAEATEE
jgi:hypothetical protein